MTDEIENHRRTSSTTQRLRDELKAEVSDRWEDGAVIRWQQGGYTLVALYVRATDRWYVTGHGKIAPNVIEGSEITVKLLDLDAEEIQVATDWESV